MEVLFAIAGTLLVVMLVGHGMWVVVAAVFRAMRESGAEHTSGHVPCVYCDRWTPESVDQCRWCGRNRRGLKAAELADLQATVRQLKRFRAAKMLDPVVAARLLDRVDQYRQRLLSPDASPPAQPAPAISPPPQPDVAAGPVPDASGAERPIMLEPMPTPAQPAVPPTVVPDRAAAGPPRPSREERPTPPKPPVQKPAATERPTQPTRPSRPVAPKSPQPPRPQAPQPAPRAAQKPVKRPARPRRVARPKPPRKSLAEMLSAFMEERNMRWG
ncbi:MAG: hypothetical protein HQ581_17040, partial [Planctomycetes bacterium]|nr:hypothetical protein [Planctomycetota bacterium]